MENRREGQVNRLLIELRPQYNLLATLTGNKGVAQGTPACTKDHISKKMDKNRQSQQQCKPLFSAIIMNNNFVKGFHNQFQKWVNMHDDSLIIRGINKIISCFCKIFVNNSVPRKIQALVQAPILPWPSIKSSQKNQRSDSSIYIRSLGADTVTQPTRSAETN